MIYIDVAIYLVHCEIEQSLVDAIELDEAFIWHERRDHGPKLVWESRDWHRVEFGGGGSS